MAPLYTVGLHSLWKFTLCLRLIFNANGMGGSPGDVSEEPAT